MNVLGHDDVSVDAKADAAALALKGGSQGMHSALLAEHPLSSQNGLE
jgi:hypothetical protein